MNGERRFYARLAVVVYVVWAVAFKLVGNFASTLDSRNLTTAADLAIPLVPQFIWPYMLCYVFPFLPLFLVRDWHRFNRALLAIVIANVTAFSVYLLFPVAFPWPDLGTTISDRTLALALSLDFDPAANKFPSLHVTFAWIVYFLCRGQPRQRMVEWGVLATAILITASTVLVKQHILFDAAGGIAWATGSWLLASRIYARWADPLVPASVVLRQVTRRLLRPPKPGEISE